jgi:hypothetical protein
MPQLYGRDLRSGDVILEVNAGGVLQQVISFGEKVMKRGNEQIIHAGILFDNRYVIESIGQGISANDIYLQDKEYSCQVFRPREPRMAAGAATCAKIFFDIHQRFRDRDQAKHPHKIFYGNLTYTAWGGLASIFRKPGSPETRDQMDAAFEQMIKGRSHPFFCSHFVVFVFQFVAEQNNRPASKIFPYGDGCVPPSLLSSTLKRHPMFEEVGYLMANER